MAHPARTALVLQGGGALGAYELGAARRRYKSETFAPDVIAGVSIGAITAVLLARPAAGLKPLEGRARTAGERDGCGRYVRVPRIISITRPEEVLGFGASDFSPKIIEQRANESYKQTELALQP